MRIGLIGVGAMGAPIATALAPYEDVTTFDADPDRAAGVAGAVRARSLIELVGNSDAVITVLPGPRETEEVIGGFVEHFAAGACWLDLSTGDPRVTRRLAEGLGSRGIGCVAAPMAGGPPAAGSRDLHFTVSGASASIDRVRSVLQALSSPGGVEVIGEDPGDAQTVKLLSNLLWFGQVIAVTEAMLLGGALGIEARRLRELLAARAGSSVVLRRDYAAVLRGEYMASFGIDRVTEQLATAVSLARDYSVPHELASLVERTRRAALETYGPIAGELLAARLLEERSGSSLASLGE